jgi:hypothetical protein
LKLKKEMNSLNKENKERLLIYNKILQVKPNLEFKFYEKLTKNYFKIINNFVEILNMIEKEIRNIQVILSENKTVHQLVVNLFTNEVESNTDDNVKQILYLELVNINEKINLYNTMYCILLFKILD